MRNIIIQYKGGGYDGCIWEWNFAYYDSNKQFHDVFSSGHQGITKPGMAQALVSGGYSDYEPCHREFYLYPLSNPKKIKEFTTETNEGLVLGVGKWLSENQDIEIQATCDDCGYDSDVSEMSNTGSEGAGGITIKMTGLVCEECLSLNSCGYCGGTT